MNKSRINKLNKLKNNNKFTFESGKIRCHYNSLGAYIDVCSKTGNVIASKLPFYDSVLYGQEELIDKEIAWNEKKAE